MGHRCPGEAITVALLTQAVNMMTRAISFAMPEQDLLFSLARIPTYPRSGVMLADVRRERLVAEQPASANVVRLRRSR
jgi:fatty-acid peroxygenase